MATPKVLIVRAPGTNCDVETAYAFERAGGRAERVHVNRLLEKPAAIDAYQIVCLPGGFSYGDDIAAGRIMAGQIRHHLRDALLRHREAGKLLLGICNGFQALMQTGLLLDDDQRGSMATLAGNASCKFEDRWVNLAVKGNKCVFLQGVERLYLPVAHAEGRFVARDEGVLKQLDSAGQLVLRYASAGSSNGNGVPYPENPNGSQADVAGLCDSSGRVLGLMPHPERHVEPTQHPRWTRGEAGETGDGARVFENAVHYFR
jgi:phosphoribosylformylglycinamidine synthase